MHGVSYGWFNGADPLDTLEVNKVITKKSIGKKN